MKKSLYTLLFLFFSLTIFAADDWHPVPAWPFFFQDFQQAVIRTTNGKTVNAKSNIHIGRHYLWYTSKDKNLEAKKGTIKDIHFADGSHFIDVKGKICHIISEDTINDKQYRLMHSLEVDMPRYNETVRNQKAAEGSSTFDFVGLNDLNIDVSVRESASIYEQEPLPIKNVFYIQIGTEVFEVTESNILKHLANKEERKAYRAYTRKAEIMLDNKSSVVDVYTTFILK